MPAPARREPAAGEELVVLQPLDAAEQGVALAAGEGALEQQGVGRAARPAVVAPPGEEGLPIAPRERPVVHPRDRVAVDVDARLELLGAREVAEARLPGPVGGWGRGEPEG